MPCVPHSSYIHICDYVKQLTNNNMKTGQEKCDLQCTIPENIHTPPKEIGVSLSEAEKKNKAFGCINLPSYFL